MGGSALWYGFIGDKMVLLSGIASRITLIFSPIHLWGDAKSDISKAQTLP